MSQIRPCNCRYSFLPIRHSVVNIERVKTSAAAIRKKDPKDRRKHQRTAGGKLPHCVVFMGKVWSSPISFGPAEVPAGGPGPSQTGLMNRCSPKCRLKSWQKSDCSRQAQISPSAILPDGSCPSQWLTQEQAREAPGNSTKP